MIRRMIFQPGAFLVLSFFLCLSAVTHAQKNKVLVFCKTAGFHHNSIDEGKLALIKLGEANKFGVDTSTDATVFSKDNLKQYKAVIFLNTTGNILDETQQAAFEQYIRSGGGFVGIHAATDTEYDWPWYGKLVGAYFKSHPATQEATLQIVDNKHISTKHLPERWTRKDEWYNYKWMSDSLHVLITIDENTYTGERMGNTHPMAWYHEFDGGRAFYTELGHTKESFTSDALYLQHLLGGIQWAMKK
ncbi:ThuA domain-containing protein [Paraflavitalea sp. CAU 1676]|uniref:ThuA domain-containing protein n=1 Tax=Paraflavitalea sp. CAU 1676 TaxID=3032598 RepID=UPI0023DC64CA|nr:ThuA domain-containing protein [Paraflavitalea sp. CAU 1676]MDF2189585.1 ThuA domain-containing protein [Paraflavitalea sp. CAU 1676]